MDMMDVIRSRRTIRLFDPRPIERGFLLELVDAARSAPSAANRQPLEYIVVTDPATRERLFELLAWAGYVQPKRNPPEGKRPTAYIVVLINTQISGEMAEGRFGPVDAAAAIQNILLGAWSMGVGSCWLASVQRDAACDLLGVPEGYAIDSVVALGYPAEEPLMEDAEDSIRYYLDEADRLHVPKRPRTQIAHLDRFGQRP